MAKKILVVGDSLSKGVVLDEQKKKYTLLKDCFFNLLAESLEAEMYNASRFGSTVTEGQKQLESKMNKYDPDIVVIEFGGNDCDFAWDDIAQNPLYDHIPKTPLDNFEAKINDMVDFVEKNDKIAVLTTLPPLYADSYFNWFTGCDKEKGIKILKWLKDVWRIYWWQERYSNCLAYIAKKRNLHCIDVRRAFLKDREFNQYICADGIHPNKEGHRLIFESALSFIKDQASYLLPSHS